jgi:hypothetical protein
MLLLGMVAFSPLLHATNVYSVGGTPNVDFALGGFYDVVIAESWTQSVSYDVAITAELGALSGSGTISAYLTNQIGPGTTEANVIASGTVALSSTVAQDVTVFSSLSLGAGTYYLVLTAPVSETDFWEGAAGGATPKTGPGVTAGFDWPSNTLVGPPDPAFPPASTFGGPYGSRSFFEVNTVPEPADVSLIAGGLGVLVLLRRGKTKRLDG